MSQAADALMGIFGFRRVDHFRDATEMVWQPIETAPKNGQRVMLANAHGVWMGEYVPVYLSGYRPDNPWTARC